VQAPFNPYEQWLGFTGERPPANYYELLGLRLYENSVQVIAQAADARTAQVRRVRPGPYVQQWQELLDQLNLAKATLLDTAAKAKYDASLRGGGSKSKGTFQPAMARDDTPNPAARQPQSRPAMPVSESPTPGIFATLDEAGSMPSNQAEPEAADPSDDDPDTAIQTLGIPVRQPAARRPAVRRKVRTRSLSVAVPVTLILLIAVAAALGYRLYQQRQEVVPVVPPDQVARFEPAVPSEPRSTDRMGAARSRNRVGRTTPEPDPLAPGFEPEVGRIPSGNASDPTEPSIGAAAEGPEEPGTEGMTGMMMPGDGSAVSEIEAPAVPEPPPSSQEQKALRAAMEKVGLALSDRDTEAARRHLASARTLAVTEAQKAQLAGLEAMAGHLDEFWNRMSRVVGQLEAGEEFLFNEEPILVVEATPQRLVLRGRGQNREYAIRDIPGLMVIRLADKYLRDQESRVGYGVFLAVDPKGDPQRARAIWETAARAGVDVESLLQVDPTLFPRSTPGGANSGRVR
jgi:hypothetical protein